VRVCECEKVSNKNNLSHNLKIIAAKEYGGGGDDEGSRHVVDFYIGR